MEIEPFRRLRRGYLVSDQLTDCREALEDGLQACGVPYDWAGSVIRITGHVRRSKPPAKTPD